MLSDRKRACNLGSDSKATYPEQVTRELPEKSEGDLAKGPIAAQRLQSPKGFPGWAGTQRGRLLEAQSETELYQSTSSPRLPTIPPSHSAWLSSPRLFTVTWSLNRQPVELGG